MLKKIIICFIIISTAVFAQKITAVIPKDFPPYYIVDKSNKVDGFAVELLNSIAQKTNLEIEYIIKKDFNEAINTFLEKKADIIPNSGISNNRKENSLFTKPTDTFKIVAFKRSSEKLTKLSEIKNKKVIVVKKNIGLKLMAKHPKELLIVKQNNKEALFSLMSGEGDVLVYPKIPFSHILKQLKIEDKIVPFGQALKEIKRAIRVQKDNPKLLAKLELGLQKLKESGEYEKVYSKWFGKHDTIEIKKSNLNRIYLIVFLIICLLLILTTFYMKTFKLKKSLALSNSRFKNMFNEHNSVMLLIEPNTGKIVDANKSAIKFYGYTKDELLNLNINQINILSKEEIRKSANNAFNKKINSFEFPHKLKDGTVKIVRVSSTPIENEKGKVLFSIIEDISEKKLIEDENKKQNKKLTTLKTSLDNAIEAASLGIWEWDVKSNLITWSDITYKIYGFDKSTKLNIKTLETIIFKEDLELHQKTIEKSLKEKKAFNFEYRITKDNELKTILAIGKPILENNEVIKMNGVVQDITDIKRKEKELLEAQRLSKIGHYDFYINKNFFTTSTILDTIFGVSKNHKKTFETWLDLIHEDDKQMMAEYFEHIVKEKLEFNKEYRIRDFQTKAIKWVHGLGVIKFNDKGEAYRMFGTIQDITQRKSFEAKMKQALAVFENTSEGIMITNVNNEIINVNKAFINTTQYSKEEVLGKNPSILKSATYPQEFYEQMWKDIKTKGFWRGEIKNKRKNNELYDEYLTINTVKDNNGNIESYIGIFSDISIMKQQEKMILQQARTSAIGEMIGNIAHQWRQPLSVISTASSGMKLQFEMDAISKDTIIENLENINEQAQFLSKTIEDFRGFFTDDLSKVTEFRIDEAINKVKHLTRDAFNNNFVEVIYELEENIYIEGNKNLLIQSLINIYNNALDVLKTKSSEASKLFFVRLYEDDSHVNITLKDNGGGIKDEIIEKIFDPYFTTKHQAQGTGIGLYMTHQIINKQLRATIQVENETFEYKGKKYTGALFTISIPKNTKQV